MPNYLCFLNWFPFKRLGEPRGLSLTNQPAFSTFEWNDCNQGGSCTTAWRISMTHPLCTSRKILPSFTNFSGSKPIYFWSTCTKVLRKEGEKKSSMFKIRRENRNRTTFMLVYQCGRSTLCRLEADMLEVDIQTSKFHHWFCLHQVFIIIKGTLSPLCFDKMNNLTLNNNK